MKKYKVYLHDNDIYDIEINTGHEIMFTQSITRDTLDLITAIIEVLDFTLTDYLDLRTEEDF
jgi:hypothetical protein